MNYGARIMLYSHSHKFVPSIVINIKRNSAKYICIFIAFSFLESMTWRYFYPYRKAASLLISLGDRISFSRWYCFFECGWRYTLKKDQPNFDRSEEVCNFRWPNLKIQTNGFNKITNFRADMQACSRRWESYMRFIWDYHVSRKQFWTKLGKTSSSICACPIF